MSSKVSGSCYSMSLGAGQRGEEPPLPPVPVCVLLAHQAAAQHSTQGHMLCNSLVLVCGQTPGLPAAAPTQRPPSLTLGGVKCPDPPLLMASRVHVFPHRPLTFSLDQEGGKKEGKKRGRPRQHGEPPAAWDLGGPSP